MNTSLLLYYDEKPYYIAVNQHGYGVDKIPAMAIRLSQKSVPFKSKPSQLLVYRSIGYVEPDGFKNGAPTWPNGERPSLVGLTTTHRGFRQSLR